MEMIKCPFECMKDKEVPLGIIFDTESVGPQVSKNVGHVVSLIMECKDKWVIGEVYKVLMQNLGDSNLQLFKNVYLRTYNRQTRRSLRFHPIGDEDKIRSLFEICRTINGLMPVFIKIVHSRQ